LGGGKVIELKEGDGEALGQYLRQGFGSLIGDRRTEQVFVGSVKGIIAAETLVCAQIGSHAPELVVSSNGEQRVRRMVKGETTKRSSLDSEALVLKLQERGLERLKGEDEVWVIHDGSDLRKPHAHEMEALMKVKELKGDRLVNGYRTINSFGIGKRGRGILYHRLFSSTEEGFVSEPEEVQRALRATIGATKRLDARVIHCMDSGFDDRAVWATIWEGGQSLVCRVCHMNRTVEQRGCQGEWQRVSLEQATSCLRELARAETELVVQKGRQTYPKLQPVIARISACPVRVSYQVEERRSDLGETRHKDVWLVRVQLDGVNWAPWHLVTDFPVVDEADAVKVLRIYRQRWTAEDTFRVTKQCLGWEDVQLLDLEGVRNLVALAWVAAGFLYELGVTYEWPEVRLLARLGGWEERKDPQRGPGKIILMRGLQRLLEMATTEAILATEIATHGSLPPRLAALIGRNPQGDSI
jgi:hypothetical protein